MTDKRDHRLNILVHLDGSESKCPHCGKVIDAATGMGDYSPKPGDVTVCLRCEGLNQFTELLHLKKMPDMVWAEMAPEEKEEIQHAIDLVRKMKQLKN